MNRLKLYLLLRKNVKLSERRNVMFDANRFGRLFTYLWMSILAIEFIALGTFLGWMGATEDTPELIFYITPLLLILDFLARFATQQTPLMLVKPYLLMPISKYAAIDCFLVGQMVSSGNLVWMTLFAPYAFIVCCGGLSVWQTLGIDGGVQQPVVPVGAYAGEPQHAMVAIACHSLWDNGTSLLRAQRRTDGAADRRDGRPP